MTATAQNSGTQTGGPARAAEAMIQIAESASPPRHLVLGASGVDAVTAKLKAALAEVRPGARRASPPISPKSKALGCSGLAVLHKF